MELVIQLYSVRVVAIALLTFCSCSPAGTQGKPQLDPAELLKKAAELSDLRSPGIAPYVLEGRVRVQGSGPKPLEGKYRLLWSSEKQWREEIIFPGYRRLRVGGENKYLQQRTTNYEPKAISDLTRTLDFVSFLQVLPEESPGKLRQRKQGGTLMDCLEIRRKGSIARELCFDAATGALVREQYPSDQPGSLGLITVREYAEFKPWAEKLVPHKVRAMRGSSPAVEFWIESLTPLAAQDPALFRPPADATVWEGCLRPQRATLVERVQPHYPERARTKHEQGTVTLYAVIEKDGSLSNLTVVRSAGSDLDHAALEAVLHWRYRPTTCDGAPVRVETVIDVSFWIQ